LFEQVTTDLQPSGKQYHQLAIVLDGELRSAPRIMEVISGGRGVIGGSFTPREAFALAYILQSPLETPLRVVEERTF
jgi:SecD/SecF fusion protein